MIAKAVLNVERPQAALKRFGGMSLVERQLWTLSRAGIPDIQVLGLKEPPGLRLPPQTWIQWDDSSPASVAGPVAILSGFYLPKTQVLLKALTAEPATDAAYLDPTGKVIFRILNNTQGPLSPDAVSGSIQKWNAADYLRLDTEEDFAQAIFTLLQRTRKDSDGFMARHFDRHLSQRITMLLLPTPVTPNQMSWVSTCIGMAGAAQFAYGEHPRAMIGAFLVWLHSVLDGCDGEMARLNFMESRWGAIMDFWGDNLVHLILFFAVTIGLLGRNPWIPWLGAVACAGALGSAVLMSWFSQVQIKSGTHQTLVKLELALAQRDFIYLLLFLAIINRVDWFIWAAAVGAPIYLVMMTYLLIYNRLKKEVIST